MKEGLLVESLARGGPGERAGIHGGNRQVVIGMQRLNIGGDVIVALDGKPAVNQLDVNVALNRKRPGEKITVTVYRGAKKMDIEVTLGERPGN